MISCYIAFYNVGLGAKEIWHWALIATEHGSLPLTQAPLHLYHIIPEEHPDADGSAGEDGYTDKHLVLPAGLPEPESWICAVQLADLNLPMVSFDAYIRTLAVGQHGTKGMYTPLGKWGCSQWAIRAFRGIVEKGFAMTRSSNSFYTAAAAKFPFWGQVLHDACLKAATDFWGDGTLPPSQEVPVLDLAAFNVNL